MTVARVLFCTLFAVRAATAVLVRSVPARPGEAVVCIVGLVWLIADGVALGQL